MWTNANSTCSTKPNTYIIKVSNGKNLLNVATFALLFALCAVEIDQPINLLNHFYYILLHSIHFYFHSRVGKKISNGAFGQLRLVEIVIIIYPSSPKNLTISR